MIHATTLSANALWPGSRPRGRADAGRQEVCAVEGLGTAGPGRDGVARHLRVRTLHSTRDQTRDALQVRWAPGPLARAGSEGPRHLNPSASTAPPPGHWLHVGFHSLPQTTRAVEAAELYIGEPVRMVRRSRRREGIIDGIQFALAPYGRDTVIVRLDAAGRVHAIPEELGWIKRKEK